VHISYLPSKVQTIGQPFDATNTVKQDRAQVWGKGGTNKIPGGDPYRPLTMSNRVALELK
jgi:hypothetical protein